jgi:hypothetical protein
LNGNLLRREQDLERDLLPWEHDLDVTSSHGSGT